MVYEGVHEGGLHHQGEHLQQRTRPSHIVQTVSERENVWSTTTPSSDSVTSPTNMCVGGLLGSFTMGCGHACT